MEDPVLTADALLNAAAVWFILKAIEIIIFALYDVRAVFIKWARQRISPDSADKEDTETYDRKRGMLEYVIAGAGFLNFDLFHRQKKLLFVSTLIPLIVFVLELMSIILGNDTKICQTSSDKNVVSAPSLVLFGEGERRTNTSEFLNETVNPSSFIRPCIKWSSSHSGVEYLSSMCADLHSTGEFMFQRDQLSLTNQSIGVMIKKETTQGFRYRLIVESLQFESSELVSSTILGTHTFISETVVNGKNILHRNTTSATDISEEIKKQLREDVRSMEEATELVRSKYFEDDIAFGFYWDNILDYGMGVFLVVYAVLAQTTEDPVRPAAKMSILNLLNVGSNSYDISCEEEFFLPRNASLIIVIVGVSCRLLLSAIPTPMSSVEFALEYFQENANSQRRATTS